MLLFHNSSAWTSALVPHQSGKGHASSAWWEGPVQKTWRPWQPSRLQRATQPRAHTHPGLPVGTTVCLNLNIHLAPEEQTASSLFTLCGSCHLSCGNPDVLLATTTALASSPPGLCHGSYCCLYSLSETGRGGCSGFHCSTTICPSDWTLNRTFMACVAFSFTLSASPVPEAIPGRPALSFLLAQKKETISRVTQEGPRGTLRLQWPHRAPGVPSHLCPDQPRPC